MCRLTEIEREFLVRAVSRQSERINKDGKALILSLCERYGVDFKPTLCQTCWHDAAVLVLQADRKMNDTPANRTIVVRDGVDVYFNGKRVNDVIITTDGECRRLMEEGMLPDYFTRVQANEDNTEDQI